MPRYLLASHDGYGLGHARRSSLLASALLDADPASRVTLVTGLPFSPSWLGARAMEIVRVPPMLKHQDHGYQALGMSFEDVELEKCVACGNPACWSCELCDGGICDDCQKRAANMTLCPPCKAEADEG